MSRLLERRVVRAVLGIAVVAAVAAAALFVASVLAGRPGLAAVNAGCFVVAVAVATFQAWLLTRGLRKIGR